MTRPCACGLSLSADPKSPGHGVRLHQATEHHRAWVRQWLTPTVPMTAALLRELTRRRVA